MSIVNHNVVKAHSFARQADEAVESRQWEAAIQSYQQAADLFLLATNDTSDLESIKALQLLSNAQSNKSKALLRHFQHFSTRNAEIVAQANTLEKISEPMEEISLSASENFFVGQAPLSTHSESYRRTQEKPVERKSTDIWGWMERMLELLVLPESFKTASPPNSYSNYAQPIVNGRDSSLMSSFYFVPAKEEEKSQPDSTQSKPTLRRSVSQVQELDKKVQELEGNMSVLSAENSDLKKKLQQAYTERLLVTKENDVMKRSIMQFRQEFNKKAHLLRDISSSVGHLPSVPSSMDQDNQTERTVQQLRAEILQLQNQVNSLTLKSTRQEHLIEKYEDDLQKFKELKRRSGQFQEIMSTSPPEPNEIGSQSLLSSSENPAPFEPDENLTSSIVLH